ncbi:MAG: hypothetical protein ACRD8U_00620 [Pyrinomonadaceae bacterium]
MKLTFGMKKPYGAFPTVAKQLVLDNSPEPVLERLSRVKSRLKYSLGTNRNPRLPQTAPHKPHRLLEAWTIARKSDASSPGVPVCYYEIVEDGYRFPGERPWADHWAMLRKITSYRDKRVLELGCNLSLFSSFLLKEEGVKDAMCVDADSRILAAAQLVSDAYEVAPLYKRVNFDSARNWERELIAFEPDIVTALSVLNWVQDKERFMRFLSNFNQVIFEGHDPFEIEKARFRKCGFSEIKEVATSERARPLILCNR